MKILTGPLFNLCYISNESPITMYFFLKFTFFLNVFKWDTALIIYRILQFLFINFLLNELLNVIRLGMLVTGRYNIWTPTPSLVGTCRLVMN